MTTDNPIVELMAMLVCEAPRGDEGKPRTYGEQAEFILDGLAERGLGVGDCWRRMDSAPKDGTDILGVSHGCVRVMFWDVARGGQWSLWPGRETAYPVAWMPLPTFDPSQLGD